MDRIQETARTDVEHLDALAQGISAQRSSDPAGRVDKVVPYLFKMSPPDVSISITCAADRSTIHESHRGKITTQRRNALTHLPPEVCLCRSDCTGNDGVTASLAKA